MTDSPDLTLYYLLHDAFRRGTGHLSNAIVDVEEGDLARARAISWYTRGLTTELRSHLVLEDAVYFPALAARVPTFAEHATVLCADHLHIHQLTAELREAARGMAVGYDWARYHDVAVDRAATLVRVVHEHLGDEDGDILPLFARHFTAADYSSLADSAVSKPRIEQLMFTVPWVLTTADPDRARALLADAPTRIALLWRLTGRRHARKATHALGFEVTAVAR